MTKIWQSGRAGFWLTTSRISVGGKLGNWKMKYRVGIPPSLLPGVPTALIYTKVACLTGVFLMGIGSAHTQAVSLSLSFQGYQGW